MTFVMTASDMRDYGSHMIKNSLQAPTGYIFPQRHEFESAVRSLSTTLPTWAGQEGPRFRLELSPGSVRVTSTDLGRKNRAENERIAAHLRKNADMLLAEVEASKKVNRGQIKAFSLKSRSRMALRLATIDYSPLFADGGVPAMVTLTMPHDWQTVAPTAPEFKKIVNRFRARYEHAWGSAIAGVWKMEFQWRKQCHADGCHDPAAPHLHIIMTPPTGEAFAKRSLDDIDHVKKCGGCEVPAHSQQFAFAEWLSRSWAAAVGHPDLAERRKHERAGTGVDYDELSNYRDPKRIGVYFTKHGLFSDKEYQNVMPKVWREDGASARYWGYWVVKPMIVSKDVHEALIMHIMSAWRSSTMSTLGPASESSPPPEGNPAPSQIQPPPPFGYPTPAQQPQQLQQPQQPQQPEPIGRPPLLGEYVTSAQFPPHGAYMPPIPPAGYYPPAAPAKRSVGKLIAIILLSVALTVALIFIAINVIQLNAANARISHQEREIQDQKDLINKKETFGAAMNDLMDTAKLFDGVLMADIVPIDDYESAARRAWDHRWDDVMLDKDTQTVIASTRDLQTLLSDAETEASTNTTGSTYEAVIDQLGGGYISSVIEDADTLCKKDVLACVISDNPYVVHFDAASNSREYMDEWLRTGIAYHEFAHVLQFTNPTATDVAAAAFDGDHETMADCFALTYLDGWTIDHTVWMNSSQYWEVSIGYGYTCNESQRQVVRDWYGQLGYTTRQISQ